MASTGQLPETMRALVLKSRSEAPTVQVVPTPQPTLGSAVVQIFAGNVISYTREVYNGTRPYPFPTPFTPGASAVGRIAAVGPDATKLKPGDLVYVDTFIRSRDEPSDLFLAGIHEGFTPGSQKLMTDVFRNWTFAEYCLSPLENLFVLNEKRLTGSPNDGGWGYKLEHLCFISTLIIPYGGLKDIEVQPGQTIIVAPATGPFGGAAVLVAQAMGARVIAMGRNKSSLEFLKKRVPKPERLEIVPITGDMEADCNELKKHGPIDAYFDIGPPEAHASTHIKSCILALRHSARISLMGGYREDVPIPHTIIMHKNMRLYGKWMYERSDVDDFIKLVQNGILNIGTVDIVGEYQLEDYKQAWDEAAEKSRFAEMVLMKP